MRNGGFPGCSGGCRVDRAPCCGRCGATGRPGGSRPPARRRSPLGSVRHRSRGPPRAVGRSAGPGPVAVARRCLAAAGESTRSSSSLRPTNLTDPTPGCSAPVSFGDCRKYWTGETITRLAAALVLADVTVAVGRAAEHVDRAAACGVLLAPAAALHDLGALVLGDHALDLEQQVLLGAAADGVAQEDDLDAAPVELLQDQDLVRIFAREPVGVEHIEAVDGPGGGLVSEPLEARAGQDAPAVAVVDEAELGVALQGVARDPLRQRLELAVDRVLLGLLFPGDTGVD